MSIRVNTKPRVSVRVNQSAGGVMSNPVNGGVAVRTVAIDNSAGGGVDTIGELLDVDVSNPQSGETLVYNANTAKYESTSLSVDGGTF